MPNADTSIYTEGDQFLIGSDIHYRSPTLFAEAIRDATCTTTPARQDFIRQNLNQLFKGEAQT